MILILTNVDLTQEQLEFNDPKDLYKMFEKRNREIRRVRSYIWNKKQKNDFERLFLNYYEDFYEEGIMAVDILKKTNYKKLLSEAIEERRVCHGKYTYHNIIMLKNKTEGPTAFDRGIGTTNFNRAYVGIQMSDLYQFIRKVMEKNDWNIDYGMSIIKEYKAIKDISKDELEVLYLLLLFPEKFWKVTNYYFNSNKSWLSRRNIQKLKKVGEQQGKRKEFLALLKKEF